MRMFKFMDKGRLILIMSSSLLVVNAVAQIVKPVAISFSEDFIQRYNESSGGREFVGANDEISVFKNIVKANNPGNYEDSDLVVLNNKSGKIIKEITFTKKYLCSSLVANSGYIATACRSSMFSDKYEGENFIFDNRGTVVFHENFAQPVLNSPAPYASKDGRVYFLQAKRVNFIRGVFGRGSFFPDLTIVAFDPKSKKINKVTLKNIHKVTKDQRYNSAVFEDAVVNIGNDLLTIMNFNNSLFQLNLVTNKVLRNEKVDYGAIRSSSEGFSNDIRTLSSSIVTQKDDIAFEHGIDQNGNVFTVRYPFKPYQRVTPYLDDRQFFSKEYLFARKTISDTVGFFKIVNGVPSLEGSIEFDKLSLGLKKNSILTPTTINLKNKIAFAASQNCDQSAGRICPMSLVVFSPEAPVHIFLKDVYVESAGNYVLTERNNNLSVFHIK